MKHSLKFLLPALCMVFLVSQTALSQTRETRNVPTFSKIDLSGSPNLYLKQGSPQSVVLEGTQEDLDHIKTEVHGNTLDVGEKDHIRDWRFLRKVTIYITVADISALTVSGSGSIEAQTKIKTGDFEATVSGSGSLTADIDAANTRVTVSGSGNTRLGGVCKAFKGQVSGSGDIRGDLQMAGDAELTVAGSGSVQVSGTASTVRADIGGSGRINTADLHAEKCYVRITGSGDVQINVSKELQADITGSGNVTYSGNPNIVNSNSSGSGKVRKL